MGNPRVTHVRPVQQKTRLATNVKKTFFGELSEDPQNLWMKSRKKIMHSWGKLELDLTEIHAWFVDLWLNDSLFRFKIVTRADVQ